MLSFDYLPQKGIMTSGMFIPPAEELPEFWISKFIPFNFPGIPSYGNAQLTANVMKPFLLTSLNGGYKTLLEGYNTVSAVAIATPGAGMTPGVYTLLGPGFAIIQVTVNAEGTVTATPVVVYGGYGYSTVPVFSLPNAAGGSPPATFTATLELGTLAPWTGQPSIQIYHNHRRVQLQLLQKTLFAPNIIDGPPGYPNYLKTPYLFAKNDQITVECSYTSVFPGYGGASNTEPNYLYYYLTMIGGEPL